MKKRGIRPLFPCYQIQFITPSYQHKDKTSSDWFSLIKKSLKKVSKNHCFLPRNVLLYLKELYYDSFGGVKMYCWKSINVHKDFGLSWLYMTSFLIILFSFSVLYIPLSIVHKTATIQEIGILYLLIALLFLPCIHSFMHILPLMVMHKHTSIAFGAKHKILPTVHYHTKKYLTKKEFLIVTLAPTVLITIPGIITSYLFADYYVYILLFTSVHIGVTFQDSLYLIHLTKAPKRSFIENGTAGIDILSD